MPEFLNRLGEVVIFEPLSHDKLKVIVKIQMKSVIERVAAKSISLSASDAVSLIVVSFQTNLMIKYCFPITMFFLF
jgi:ATP-dependent Clp protease ATP-binding subunit ClpA